MRERGVAILISYLLENKVGITATDTLDGAHSEHDVSFAVNVGVHHTQNMLEVCRNNQRHLERLRCFPEIIK